MSIQENGGAFNVAQLQAQGSESIQQSPLRGPEIINTENFTMTLGSRLQVRYNYLERDNDSSVSNFSIRRARFSLGGRAYEHFGYAMQLELAGSSVKILDANVRYQLAPFATFWAGQGKAFFGRQQLNSSGNLNFVDRTLVDGRFSAGRQAGIALIGKNDSETFEYNLGIYNGTGINTPNPNNKHMFVARVVLTPLGAYSPVESAHDYPDSPLFAIGASGLHTFTGTGPNETKINRLNIEGAFKIKGWNTTSELYLEEAMPVGDDRFTTTGWYIQSGFLFPNRRNEIALRYGIISPNNVPLNSDVIEIGGSVSHYILQHRAKIQADIRNVERKALNTNNPEFRLQLQLTL